MPKECLDDLRPCDDYMDSIYPLLGPFEGSIPHLMDMQRQIMDHVPGGDIPEKMAHQITCGLGLMEETLEYLNSIGRKPWRPIPLPLEDQLEELVDILHFFLEMIIRSGFSWDEMVEAYRKKHTENLERYRKGKEGDYSWDKRGKDGSI